MVLIANETGMVTSIIVTSGPLKQLLNNQYFYQVSPYGAFYR